jgi:hypothetical protein
MNSYSFIADMNGLQQEMASLHPEVAKMIVSLLEMVEEQERLLKTMLDVNKKLLDKK